MRYWQAWMAWGLLTMLPAAAQADIFRWDDGQLIPGTEGYTPGPGVDLSSFSLPFADFSGGLDLTEANFYGSSLDNSRFNGANLTSASLEAASLTNADLSGTNLTDASLEAATLTNANLAEAIVTGASLTAVGFTSQHLYSTASYQQRNLRGIGLSGSDLTGWDFSGQDLTNARLARSDCGGGAGCSSVVAILTNANLAGAVVTGAQFSGNTSFGFTKEQLYSTASYRQRNLRGIGLSYNDLTAWDFRGQDLTGAVLSESHLTNANLAGAMVTGASFLGTSGFTAAQLYSTQSYQAKNLSGIALGFNDLTGWDFSGHDLTGADFFASILANANFTGAMVTGAGFLDATSRGFTKEQLYSMASYQQRNLRGIRLFYNDLTGWDFSGQDLTGAVFFESFSTNANFAGAMVTGAIFSWPTLQGHFTKEQLYSTASYQQRNLRGIGLVYNDLTGWDFSGQDLTGAVFYHSTLTNANFSFADLRGALMNTAGPFQNRNTIRESGAINGLDLAAGETLVVRDSNISITVHHSMNAVSGGALELVIGDADWGSTMAVAAGVTPDLGGTLRIRFADQENLASMVGTTFDFFDWPGVLDANNRFDAIELPPGTQWDVSQLYVTGTAKLTAIPEPSAAFTCGACLWMLLAAAHRPRAKRRSKVQRTHSTA